MPNPRSSAPSACSLTLSTASVPPKDYPRSSGTRPWPLPRVNTLSAWHNVTCFLINFPANLRSRIAPPAPARASASSPKILPWLQIRRSFIPSWMQSPHHRENILDPELNVVGIAVVKGSDGLFAVQDFSQAVANLNLQQQEQEIISNLNARGLRATQATADARKTCELDRGFTGTRPLSVVRFETADLKKLPDDLEQKLRTGRYRSAAVGACQGGESAGFTRFRIAVVLY